MRSMSDAALATASLISACDAVVEVDVEAGGGGGEESGDGRGGGERILGGGGGGGGCLA